MLIDFATATDADVKRSKSSSSVEAEEDKTYSRKDFAINSQVSGNVKFGIDSRKMFCSLTRVFIAL